MYYYNKDYNFFNSPQHYRKLLLNSNVFRFDKEKINGKSLACIFLTRFCSVGCSFCFFQSPSSWKNTTIDDQFNDEGIEKFIDFTRLANLGYILVSGGGEPLNRKQHVLKIIEEAITDRIVLVTSGSWARNYNVALNYIQTMHNLLNIRKTPTHLVIRVSVSDYHSVKLGISCAQNIINIFDKYFSKVQNFSLQIKTFEQDNSINELLKTMGAIIKESDTKFFESDNEILEKKIPKKLTAVLKSGYQFYVGVSKIFHSCIKPNLNSIEILKKEGIKVFEEDLQYSEDYNSTLVYNKDGTKGLDWSIGYNGNVCTWQNQCKDNYKNLYYDNYENIIKSYMNDPLTYSVIDKGNVYRENLVNEVNAQAVLRSKSIGLRDSVGAVLFEEEKTRLYYTIRVIQDYIYEKKILLEDIKKRNTLLFNIVSIPKQNLIKLYKESKYNIIDQQKNKVFNEVEWYDLFELIKLGHYIVPLSEIKKGLSYYNMRANRKIVNLNDIQEQKGDIVIKRFTERLIKL